MFSLDHDHVTGGIAIDDVEDLTLVVTRDGCYQRQIYEYFEQKRMEKRAYGFYE
ncbi:hypothetical protein [Halegenticoccus soli]|uniref:hypothetical protein n=1 Tax=Halegenticoccus soli TaxID=1985678 RepID=UPI00130472E4|nr:hypothetical protein [Halegenticoccus soli]